MPYKLLHYFTGKDVDYPSGHPLMDCQNFLLIIVSFNQHKIISVSVNGFYVISELFVKKTRIPKIPDLKRLVITGTASHIYSQLIFCIHIPKFSY